MMSMYIPIAVEPTRRLATSALPDAPVVPDQARLTAGAPAAAPARRAAAGLLRQLADRVEPRPALG